MALRMTRLRSYGRRLSWAFVCCLALFVTPRAQAQSAQETALARSLFSEGVTLADKADWAGAADRFGRAYAIKPTSGIAFNYASALIELGRYVEASELLRVVARDGQASEDLRRQSEEKLRFVEPHIAYLSVYVEGDPGPNARVDVDDHEWPRVAWGVASPLDPGSHTVRCVVDGVERSHESIELSPGQRGEVTLKVGLTSAVNLLPKVQDPDASDNTPPPLDSESHGARKPLYKNWMLWTGVGVAVVAGVVAGVLVASKGTKTTGEVAGNVGGGTIAWPP
jgi:hypothetical protein